MACHLLSWSVEFQVDKQETLGNYTSTKAALLGLSQQFTIILEFWYRFLILNVSTMGTKVFSFDSQRIEGLSTTSGY
jgi:hypothetical protein